MNDETNRNPGLRCRGAAELGANDSILSTASLALGVAAGEFVSIHSQQDSENADLARKRAELTRDPVGAALPIVIVLAAPTAYLILSVTIVSLVFLARAGRGFIAMPSID